MQRVTSALATLGLADRDDVVAKLGLGHTALAWGFFLLVVAERAGLASLLDKEYNERGFCVTPSPDSFVTSFAVDTAATAFLLLCTTAGRREMKMTTMSVFVHGVYHLVQFVAGWPLPRKVELPIGVIFVATQLFSMGIGSVVGGTAHLAAATAAVILVSLAFVDHTTSFAYGNAWIFSVSTFVGIRMGGRGGWRKSKGGSSNTSLAGPLLIFASTLAPFCEGILCNRGYKALGGHMIFDALVAFGIIAHARAVDAARPGGEEGKGSKDE